MVTIAAGFVSRSVFVRPRDKEDEAKAAHQGFQHPTSDALTLLNVWEDWRAAGENGKPHEWARQNFLSSRALKEIERNRDQMLAALEHEGIPITSSRDETKIRKAVASGLIVNLCLKSNGMSYTWQGRSDIYIHPGSGLFQTRPRMMVCTEVMETSKAFARQCTAIEEDWLAELIPAHAIQTSWEIRGNGYGETAHLVALRSWQGTTLKEERVEEFPPAALPAIIAKLVAEIKESWGAILHPEARANNQIYSEVVKVLAESLGVNTWDVPPDLLALINERISAVLTSRLETARSLRDIQEADLGLKTEDMLPVELAPELVAKLEAVRQDLETKRRESAEEERKHREEAEKRKAELETDMKPLREKATDLLERANRLARGTASWSLQSIRDARPLALHDIRLAELRRARTELESVIAVIKQLEQEASRDKVRKLAFQMVNGQAEARQDGRCYRSVFQEAYPQPGETWICLVKNEQMEYGQTVTYVIPKFRTGSISDSKDLDELSGRSCERCILAFPRSSCNKLDFLQHPSKT